MASAWLWALPLLGLGQWALAYDNLKRFQRPYAGAVPADTIAVLVPARNEGVRIGDCVRSILAQPEVTRLRVLDDQSEDDTAARAVEAAQGDPRFTLLRGAPRPAGWTGKNHACHQLAMGVEADWLLFVDADATLAPGAAAEAVRRARASDADLLSFWPRQAIGSLGEGLLVPMMDLVLLGYLPMALAEARPDPSLAAANGQCLLFARPAYERLGGHAAVKGDLVDDVALARGVRRLGGRVVLSDAGPWVRVRMYHGLAEAWAGFTKNLYPAFGGRPGPFVFGMGLFALGHAVPPILALVGALAGWGWLWGPMLAQTLVALAVRALIARRLAQPAWSVLLHPLSAWLVVALGLASWRAAATGRLSWKGRTYALEARP